MPNVLTLIFPFLPPAALSANSHAHWRGRQRAAKRIRTDAYLYAKQQQPKPLDIQKALVTIQVRCHNPNQRRDLDNYLIRLKPFFDGGLVDARIIVDDSWKHLRTQWAQEPFIRGDDAVILEIEEVLL